MTDAEIMRKNHWAIIKGVTTHHLGDERSRNNSGHGYPAHTTTALVYTPYGTKAEVIAAVERKPNHEKWTIIQATAMTVKTSIEIANTYIRGVLSS